MPLPDSAVPDDFAETDLANIQQAKTEAPRANSDLPDDFAERDFEESAQFAGAQKALLASSLAGAVESKPEHKSKVVALADKLNLSADVVEGNYDYLNRRVQLRDLDYNHLLQHHPEMASWLTVPENAALAHDDMPVLQMMDNVARRMDGRPHDPTGILPDGYMFKADGTIRGPLHEDGSEPVVYKSLDVLRQKFQREEANQEFAKELDNRLAEQLQKSSWFPNIEAGAAASIAGTFSAVESIFGEPRGAAAAKEIRQAFEQRLGAQAGSDPGIAGGAARLIGSLIGDAPLYMLGGEVAAVADLTKSLTMVKALSARLPAVARSEYAADFFKTAAVYSPIGIRSGVNAGADEGVGFGTVNGLINTFIPALAGSRLGIPAALLKGSEAGSASWMGAAGRLGLHVGSQGGIMATTELANAIHEVASGVDPDALKSENLVPRLMQAGFAGGILAGAFHLPGMIGAQMGRQQIAAHAALQGADDLGVLVELAQASKLNQRSGTRAKELLDKQLGDTNALQYFQGDEWEGIAKDAGMTGDELAAAMNVEEQWRVARAAGSSMQVKTSDLVMGLAGMKEETGIKAIIGAARTAPEATSAAEGVEFFKTAPDLISKGMERLKADILAEAATVSEADPIYKDFVKKAMAAGRPEQEARDDARIMAARFNTRAVRWNAEAAERGAPIQDPFVEYQREIQGVYGQKDLPFFLKVPGAAEGVLTQPQRLFMLDRYLRTSPYTNKSMGHFGERAFKTPVHLVDGSRISGFNNAERTVVYGYDKNGEVFTQNVKDLKPGDIILGDRANETAVALKLSLEQSAHLLEQPGKQEKPRGYYDPVRKIIVLTEHQNFSTVIHEMGHSFLELMNKDASDPLGPAYAKTDLATVLDFLGVKSWADVGRAQHEKFARAWETYTMEGKAPSPELVPVFQRFAIWMKNVYRGMKGLVALTPEVTSLFDRLLATDEAIARAKEEVGQSSTIFKNAEDFGLGEAKWQQYLKLVQQEKDSLYASVFRTAMAAIKSENSRVYRRELAATTARATEIVNARPESRAEDLFVKGVDADGKTLTDKPKLDRKEITDIFGPEAIKALPRGTTEEGGLGLKAAADAVNLTLGYDGYKSGAKLVEDLMKRIDRKDAIKVLADEMIKAENPELTPEAMIERALDAVHENQATADLLNLRSAALAFKAKRTAEAAKEIKLLAETIISETNQRDVKPNKYRIAQRKANRETEQAFLKEDFSKAFDSAQRAELNFHLFREALEAKKVLTKTNELFADAKRRSTREMLGKAGGESWRVKLSDGQYHPTVFWNEPEAQDAASALAGTLEAGPTYVSAMDELRGLWNTKTIRDSLTAGQVNDVYREAKAIMHQAREAFSVRLRGERQKLQDVSDALTASGNANAKPVSVKPWSKGAWTRLGGWALAKFDAFHRKFSFVAREMDGEKEGGTAFDYLVRPLNAAGDAELSLKIANAEAMQKLTKDYGKSGKLHSTEFIPAIGGHMSLETKLMVFLNWGSTRNRERILRAGVNGNKVTAEQVDAIIKTLDKADITFAKGVADLINSHWPAIKRVTERLTGLPPEKRDSLPIETAHGFVDGHYFPLVYDPEASARFMDLELASAPKRAPTTVFSGFTKATVESTGRPLLFDSRAIFQHLDGVSHFISHAEVASDMSKLLNDVQFKNMVIDRYGMNAYKVLRDTIQAVNRGPQGPQNLAESIVRWLRIRSGMAVMGFNAMSGTSQLFGMTQAMERVGAANYLRSQLQVFANAGSVESSSATVKSMSEMMRNRDAARVPEAIESLDVLKGTPDWVRQHAYWMMNKMQWLVDVPTWLAAHESALKEFPGDSAKCVALADQAVLDTQGSGMMKDLSHAQRANEFAKTLMQFGSFFSSTYNMLRAGITNATFKDPSSIARLAGSFWMLVFLPATAMAAFQETVRKSPENDGTAGYWAKHLASANLGYLLNTVMLGRELSGALAGFDYKGPSGMRAFSVLSDLIKQVSQGKADHGLERALIASTGLFWGLPSNQLQRIIDGIMYDLEHGSTSPLPVIYGPPPKRHP
jgi:hypothetical protein